MIDLTMNRENLKRSIERAREKNIIIPEPLSPGKRLSRGNSFPGEKDFPAESAGPENT